MSATTCRGTIAPIALYAMTIADRMDAHVAAVAAALDDPDPWHGLVGFDESVCAMQAADYGFADVLTMTFPTAKALEEPRREVHDGVVELIGRAKVAGRLREDFTPEDLLLVYLANAGVVNATGEDAPDAWRRVVALMIQALEAPARGPLPDSPGPDALYKATLRASKASFVSPQPGKSS